MSESYPSSTPAPTSTLAMISLIAGIIGLTLFPLLGSIVAVITGPMAKREIAESGGTLSGENLAQIGMVLGWIGLGLGVVGCCLMVLFIVVPLFAVAATEGFSFVLPSLLIG